MLCLLSSMLQRLLQQPQLLLQRLCCFLLHGRRQCQLLRLLPGLLLRLLLLLLRLLLLPGLLLLRLLLGQLPGLLLRRLRPSQHIPQRLALPPQRHLHAQQLRCALRQQKVCLGHRAPKLRRQRLAQQAQRVQPCRERRRRRRRAAHPLQGQLRGSRVFPW